MGKKIDLATVKSVVGTFYPTPYDQPCRARARQRLGDAAGLTQFGVNLTRLPPGTWSSQPHFHTHEDEFVFVVSGELVLVTGSGEEILRAGDAAGFKAADEDGHCLQNRSDQEAVILEIGTRAPHAADIAHYPGLDLVARADGRPAMYTHKDKTPYKDIRRRGPDDP